MAFKDLSALPQGQTEGVLPDPQPYFAPVLAQAWADTLDDGTKDMAFPEARIRHSQAAGCARAIGYAVAGVAQTEPPDIAARWVMGLGTMVHELWQEQLAKLYPDAEIEKKVWIERCKSAGHIDAHLPRGAALLGEGEQDRDLLVVDRGVRARLRGGVGGDTNDASASTGVGADGGSDPAGVASRPSVSGESVRTAGSPGTGDVGGEQPASGGGEDALPEGARVHHGEPGPSNRSESNKPGVLGVRSDQVEGLAGSTTIEVKTINGMGAKMAVGARGPAEGPRLSALVQLALNAYAADAQEARLVLVFMENMSPREAAKLGPEPWRRFCAEWTFTRDQFEPMAETEINRFVKILALVDEGRLPPRAIPGTPPGARIVDVDKGAWQVTSANGDILDAGTTWHCNGYCNWQSQCRKDGM